MAMNMDHDHTAMNMSNKTMPMTMHWTHMTFFWGAHSEILFDGWPGARAGMYVLALIAVFLLAVLYEWCNHCRLIKRASRSPTVAVGLAQTALHAIRVGLMYLTMLAVMSFNVGVLIVVILGHAVGFLLFGSAAVNESDVDGVTGEKQPDLHPVGC